MSKPVYLLSEVPGFNEIINKCDGERDENDESINKFVCTKTTHIGIDYKIIHYDKSILSNDLINSIGLIRSVIINSKKEVVCFSPPKSFKAESFIQVYPYKSEEIIAEEFIEGTMINVFWNKLIGLNGGFEIATRNTIGADVIFFKKPNNKTFKSMFLEACECAHFEINSLNKEYCYSFVLQHPDNRIVVPFATPQLYLVAVYKIENNSLTSKIPENVNDKIRIFPISLDEVKNFGYWSHTTIKFPQTYSNWNSYSDLIDTFASPNTPYNVLGVIIKNTSTGMRCKIRNPIYEEVRQLRGNQPKNQFQYLTLRKQGKVGDFLKYYPELKKEFSSFRDQLHMFTNNLFRNYISCYIKKEKPLIEFPVQYRTYMFKLHEKYINDLKPDKKYITNTVVIEFVNELPPAHQMHSLNFNLSRQQVDSIKIATKM